MERREQPVIGLMIKGTPGSGGLEASKQTIQPKVAFDSDMNGGGVEEGKGFGISIRRLDIQGTDVWSVSSQ